MRALQTSPPWPLELSFQCTVIPEQLQVDSSTFGTAVPRAHRWLDLASGSSSLALAGDAAAAAPTLAPLSQSLLHIWSGLEALFPSVTTELAFRLALYLAQLSAAERDRTETYDKAREAYRIRSKVTHGSQASVSFSTWIETWELLVLALKSVFSRGQLPKEEELLAELLGQERAV